MVDVSFSAFVHQFQVSEYAFIFEQISVMRVWSRAITTTPFSLRQGYLEKLQN